MNAPSGLPPSRKAQAFAFISARLASGGSSPSIPEIAAAIGVSKTRAQALVHQLAVDRMIERAPGAQRAISVPGLLEKVALEQLAAAGWTINPSLRTIEREDTDLSTCPKDHLPLIAELDHIPDVDFGDGRNGGMHDD